VTERRTHQIQSQLLEMLDMLAYSAFVKEGGVVRDLCKPAKSLPWSFTSRTAISLYCFEEWQFCLHSSTVDCPLEVSCDLLSSQRTYSSKVKIGVNSHCSINLFVWLVFDA
jgi:hypothetical protein